MKKTLILLSLVLAAGCFQDHNKSIEVMNKGVEEARQKLYDSSVRDLKQALLIDPTNAAAAYNLGVVYKDARKWPDAVDAFQTAAKYDTDNPALHYELGNALFENNKPDDAKGEFETALKLDPKLYKAHYRLGVVLQSEEKPRDADAEYRKAIEANPRFIPPYIKLGDLYLDNDYDKEAMQVFQNAVLANDADPDAHRGLAESMMKQKQYEGAVKEYKRAVELDPDLYLGVYNIGHCYAQLGDKKNAKEWLQKFVMNFSGKAGPDLTKAANDEIYALGNP